MRSLKLVLALLLLSACAGLDNAQVRIENTWDGRSYAQTAQLQSKWAEQFFFRKYNFRGDEAVLDVGSGDGRITSQIAYRVPRGRVVGLDNSDSMIAQARKSYGLNIIRGDAGDEDTYLPLKEQFDLVVSFHTLHWIPQQEAALRGIALALKKNGYAYLRLTSNGFDPVQLIADDMIKTPQWKEHFEGFKDPMLRYSADAYRQLLTDAQLETVSIVESKDADILKDAAAMVRQIKSWLPHAKYLPEDLKMAFLRELVEQYVSKYGRNSDGTITLYDCYLEVVAKKA